VFTQGIHDDHRHYRGASCAKAAIYVVVCTGSCRAYRVVLFRVMGLIVRLAPLGLLGAVAYTVGKYGVGSLKQLISLVALFYVSLAIFVRGVLGGVMALAGLNNLKFLSYLREELTIVLLPPPPMRCCRRSCASSSAWA
jgi:Na+/H+-dicarboxylate symporter